MLYFLFYKYNNNKLKIEMMSSKGTSSKPKCFIPSINLKIENSNNLLSFPKKIALKNIIKNNITEPTQESLYPKKIQSVNINNSKKINIKYSNIKYGIDESGNPINIKEYYKSINDSIYSNSNTSIYSGLTSMTNNKLKRPIAYITKDSKGNNILIDLKGNIITKKNKEGDYYFPFQLHVLVKDFDVKHPELRINGERYYKEKLEIIEDNENEDNNINKKEIKNEIIKNGIRKELFNINKNNSKNKNIISNKNKILLRTYDILQLKKLKCLTEENRKNIKNKNIQGNNNKYRNNRILTKNLSYIIPNLKLKINNKLHISKSKDDFLSINRKKIINEDINNKLKQIFCLNNNKIKIEKRNNLLKKINNDYNNYKLNKSLNNNNKKRLENKTYKYFIMGQNKSYMNSNNNIKEKNNIIKRIYKNRIIPFNKSRNNNIYINVSKTNKIYNNNNIKSSCTPKKREGFNCKNFILNKIRKKKLMNEWNKANKSQKNYILSEEAENMIKSYSRKKLQMKKFKK